MDNFAKEQQHVNGVFDFMTKFVRPDKQDGKYLSRVSGEPDVWNWKP